MFFFCVQAAGLAGRVSRRGGAGERTTDWTWSRGLVAEPRRGKDTRRQAHAQAQAQSETRSRTESLVATHPAHAGEAETPHIAQPAQRQACFKTPPDIF